MSRFFLQALTSFLIAHLVFLPTLAQAQMKGTALQPPQSPPESVRSIKPGQFITFKDDDLVHNSLYFSFDDSKSLLEQISDQVVDKNAQNCATLLLKDSLYKDMAAKSLNGPAVMHTDMLKPMEKDCGNVLVKLIPTGFELTPQKMTELRKNDPVLAQLIDRSLGIQEAQAGLGLLLGVSAGLGVGLGLIAVYYEVDDDIIKGVTDAITSKIGETLSDWCLEHPTDEICNPPEGDTGDDGDGDTGDGGDSGGGNP